jgi:lipopolysaccharide transport protein LptA
MKIRSHFEFLILNFKFNSKSKIQSLIFILLPVLLISNGRAQQSGLSHASNFTSIEYFEAPNQRQMKTRLTGAEALPLAGGLLVIKQLTLETFEPVGKLEFTVGAPECIYDALKGAANSAGRLQMQTGDGTIRVEGDGFLWRQNDSLLTISNNVRTTIISATLAVASSMNAQTNVVVATPSTPRDVTRIDSDSANFDMNARRVVYLGHVIVNDPQMKMTCDKIVADLPPSGARMNHIVAETNVVIDLAYTTGQTMHATSDKAVYHYSVENGATNETVTLTGNPQIVNAQGVQSGDEIIWNRAGNQISFVNPHMIFRQSFNNVSTVTNSSTLNTNAPVKTNFPAGTIPNIDQVILPAGSPKF